MEKQFRVRVLTPQGKVFEGGLVSLIVPAALGYLGVLANHAPLITGLSCGKIIYRDTQGRQDVIYNKGNGLMAVLNNEVDILLEEGTDALPQAKCLSPFSNASVNGGNL